MNLENIKSKKTWALVDCDSFFASCEILRNPKYRWMPVCVWKEIVLACSYEAKSYWIKTWTPIWEAQRILWSKWIYLGSDIKFYWNISKRLMWLLTKFANNIQIFSIDEAFIDITWLDKKYNMSYQKLLYYLKLKIKKEIWIPVSIWAWETKLLAKIFAKYSKPFWSYYEIDQIEINELFKQIPVREIPFIWRQSEDKIKYISKSIYDFKSLPIDSVKKKLMWPWCKIWFELNWINALDFEENKYPLSISRTYSFNPYFTNQKNILRWHLLTNLERAFEELITSNLKTKYIKIFLRKKDFHKLSCDIILPIYSNDKEYLTKMIKSMFESIYFNDIFFRWTGVIFWQIKEDEMIQTSLFENQKSNKKLWQVIDTINKKFGRFTIAWANSKLNNLYNSKQNNNGKSLINCMQTK